MTTKQKFYSYIEELCAYAIADCEVNDKKADEFWEWFNLKMEEAYKRGREDEAIECQKDMERMMTEEVRRQVLELGPDVVIPGLLGTYINKKRVIKILDDSKLKNDSGTNTGVTIKALDKRFNKKEFVRLANEVKKILDEEKRTMTGAYDVTTRAGKKGKR